MKNKILLKKICITIILILITLIIALNTLNILAKEKEKINNIHNSYNIRLLETDKILQEKDTLLEEKQKLINNLEKEKKQKEEEINKLNNEIQLLNKKNKQVTSRSGSSKTATTSVSVQPVKEEKWIWANVSAYCSCKKCCGKTNGITASGTKATAGRTIAAPKNYSFGTKIEIKGMGTYIVEDRGGAITGNKIDVYFDSHQKALKFGRQQLQIKIVD